MKKEKLTLMQPDLSGEAQFLDFAREVRRDDKDRQEMVDCALEDFKGYGTEILQLTLEKARRRKFKRVLITCDDDNAASARIIEKNGGILRDKIQNEGRPTLTRRYWIELK
jgi:hypothetical protein